MNYKLACIVCGDRHWSGWEIPIFFTKLVTPTLIIEGGAPGADTMAGDLAISNAHLGIEHICIPAEWDKFHRAAGPIRNQEMLKTLLATDAEQRAVVFFHRDIQSSRGTKNMIMLATRQGIPIYSGIDIANNIQVLGE